MLSFLRQPFPVSELGFSRAVALSLLFGAIIALSLIVFQPFGSYNYHAPNKNWMLSGYGLVAAVSVFLNFYAFRKLVPQVFSETRWTVGKEIGWNLLHFITGGFLSTVYGAALGIMPFTLAQVGFMILVAFLMGVVPSVMIVLIIYVYLLQKYRPLPPSVAAETAPAVLEPVSENEAENIRLSSENEKDPLLLHPNQLLYLEASDNYCTVFYLQDGQVQKQLLRSSLSRLEGLINQPDIVRCHRSYLVNLGRVQSVSGNAQGYRLHFDYLPETVPVARASSSLVKSFFVNS